MRKRTGQIKSGGINRQDEKERRRVCQSVWEQGQRLDSLEKY